MNRPDISRLNKNRGIFLKIGFLISISLVIMAFNITVYEYEKENYEVTAEADDIFKEVVRTIHQEKKKSPPPTLEPSDKIIDDNQEFIEDPLPEKIDTELKVDTQQIRRVNPIVFKAKPKSEVDLTPKEPVDKEPPIFTFVEEMPRFPGCEDADLTKKEKKACADKALLEFLGTKINYPKMARANGIEGTVALQFVVEKTGQISDIKIVKEIGGGCGKEVVRVVNKMPNWIPGKQRGREVPVRYTLPVKFNLQ